MHLHVGLCFLFFVWLPFEAQSSCSGGEARLGRAQITLLRIEAVFEATERKPAVGGQDFLTL